jgi:hypothetical protein
VFDHISRLAERTANNLSRRSFLTGLGQGALSVAALLGVTSVSLAGKTYCVKNGGCCGGTIPYQMRFHVGRGVYTYACTADPTCQTEGVLCANATCCNGGGYCSNGVTCSSDIACNTPC